MEDAERQYNMTIVMHQSGDELHLYPKYDEVIKIDDVLVVFATLEGLGQIGGMNHAEAHHHTSQNLLKRLIGRNR